MIIRVSMISECLTLTNDFGMKNYCCLKSTQRMRERFITRRDSWTVPIWREWECRIGTETGKYVSHPVPLKRLWWWMSNEVNWGLTWAVPFSRLSVENDQYITVTGDSGKKEQHIPIIPINSILNLLQYTSKFCKL